MNEAAAMVSPETDSVYRDKPSNENQMADLSSTPSDVLSLDCGDGHQDQSTTSYTNNEDAEQQRSTKYNNSEKLEPLCSIDNSSNEIITKEYNSNDVESNRKRKIEHEEPGNIVVGDNDDCPTYAIETPFEESSVSDHSSNENTCTNSKDNPSNDRPTVNLSSNGSSTDNMSSFSNLVPTDNPSSVNNSVYSDNPSEDTFSEDPIKHVDNSSKGEYIADSKKSTETPKCENGSGSADNRTVPSSYYFTDRNPSSAHSSASGSSKERNHYSRSSYDKSSSSSHKSFRSQSSARDPDEGKIFVGGLSWDTTDESLRTYFSKFDKLTDSVVMKTPEGKTRGFAFVTFEDPSVVDTILAQTHYIDGKRVDPKSAIPRDAQHKAEKMFIGGLPWGTTEEELKRYFSSFGTVLSVTLMVDQESNQSRGFGFITFKTATDLQNALSCQPHVIKGQTVETTRALPKSSSKEDIPQPQAKRQNRSSPPIAPYPQRQPSNMPPYGYRHQAPASGYMMPPSSYPLASSSPSYPNSGMPAAYGSVPQGYPPPPQASLPYASSAPSAYPPHSTLPGYPSPSTSNYSPSSGAPMASYLPSNQPMSNYPPSGYPSGSVRYTPGGDGSSYMQAAAQGNYGSPPQQSPGGQQTGYYGPTSSVSQQPRQNFYGGGAPPQNPSSAASGPARAPQSSYYGVASSYYSPMPSGGSTFQSSSSSQYPSSNAPPGAAPSTYQGLAQGNASAGIQKPMSSFYSR